jgi:cation:H+ antiporter
MVLAQAIGLLIFGFIILIKGADFLVDGASAVAKKFNISDMVIGLTIVSFGTSAPELVVNIDAAMHGENDLIIGNILGSNIFNTCLILGGAGLIYPMMVQKTTVFKEFPFSVAIILLMFFLANDAMLWGGDNVVSHIDGIIFLSLFLGFLYYVYSSSKNTAGSDGETIENMPIYKSLAFIIGGMVGLVLGGNLVLNNAVFLAEEFGMTKRVIGLTVIAIGTSLPELATSVVAALKKNSDIAIGNVVGSNIFNILLVLGVSASISPTSIGYDVASNFDIYFLLIMTTLLFVFFFVGTKGKTTGGTTTYVIDRWQSGVLLVAVLGYIVYLLTMPVVT